VLSADLEYGSTGRYKRRVILSHNLLSGPKYAITLTGVSGATVEIGSAVAGNGLSIASTHADVRVGGRSFSDIREDEFGNTRMVKRPRKRELTATAQIASTDGDYVDHLMAQIEGGPAVFDLNNTSGEIERLLVQGWASDWYTTVTGLPDLDLLVISPLRGLAE
jgi:hypothetical protein